MITIPTAIMKNDEMAAIISSLCTKNFLQLSVLLAILAEYSDCIASRKTIPPVSEKLRHAD